MNFDDFFTANPDFLPIADLVVQPPDADELQAKYPEIDRDLLARHGEGVSFSGVTISRGTLYWKCRLTGSGDRFAAMLALGQPPGIETTDTFWAGRKSWVDVFGPDYAADVKKRLARQGVNLKPGDEYMPELARYRGDKEAVVPFGGGRSYIKSLCQRRGWACILPNQTIQGNIIGGSKARYSGKAVELLTRSGARISVTPNHPILTMKGLSPAGHVNKGDYLLRYVGEYKPFTVSDDKQYAPSVSEQVFSSLKNITDPVFPSMKFRCTAFDFHGDAARFDGDIEAVGTYCQLPDNIVSNAPHGLSNDIFVGTNSKEFSLSGGSHFGENVWSMSLSASGVVGGLDLLEPHFGGHSAPHQAANFGQVPQCDSVLSQAAREDMTLYASFICDLTDRRSSEILLDDVVEVRYFDWSGHVYDFESSTGYILCNDLCISNCNGAVTTEHRQPESDPLAPENCVALSERIIRRTGKEMIAANPDLKRQCATHAGRMKLKAEIVAKHGLKGGKVPNIQ